MLGVDAAPPPLLWAPGPGWCGREEETVLFGGQAEGHGGDRHGLAGPLQRRRPWSCRRSWERRWRPRRPAAKTEEETETFGLHASICSSLVLTELETKPAAPPALAQRIQQQLRSSELHQPPDGTSYLQHPELPGPGQREEVGARAPSSTHLLQPSRSSSDHPRASGLCFCGTCLDKGDPPAPNHNTDVVQSFTSVNMETGSLRQQQVSRTDGGVGTKAVKIRLT